MKLVLIHGQNHKGSSYHIGRLLAEQFSGNEIEEFFLPKDLEHFCVGCYACITDEEKCPFYQEKKKIMDKVEEADLLIFTTPTYCQRASAPMKTFMDLTFTYWMSHKPRRCMFSKKAIVISTAAGAGMKSATKEIQTMLFYWGVPYIREYGISVQAMNWDQVSDKKKRRIKQDMERLANRIARHQSPQVGFKTRFVFGLMRMMQKKGLGASAEDTEYWRANGWLDEKRPWSVLGEAD